MTILPLSSAPPDLFATQTLATQGRYLWSDPEAQLELKRVR